MRPIIPLNSGTLRLLEIKTNATILGFWESLKIFKFVQTWMKRKMTKHAKKNIRFKMLTMKTARKTKNRRS